MDINPLAVELAKLSMWLTTLAKGKPLSFLDHHIRVGNSLVGTSIFEITDDLHEEKRRKQRARAAEKAAASGQAAMFTEADFISGVRFAVEQMAAIEVTTADSVSDVKHQEQLYAALTQRLSVWQQAADVWTARAFGLVLADALGGSFDKKEWEAIRQLAFDDLPPYVRDVVRKARGIAAEQQFFHWELAFPEIFFDEDGQPKAEPGFDAVVGNPPYVRMEEIKPIKPFLQTHYESHESRADLFLYFYERGLQFLKQNQYLGFITSGTFMNSNSATNFRSYVNQIARFEWLVDFGAIQPFKGVDLATNVAVSILKHTTKSNSLVRAVTLTGRIAPTNLQAVLLHEGFDSFNVKLGDNEWRFQPVQLTNLQNKIVLNSSLLHETGADINYGVKTGLNDAFIIDRQAWQSLITQDPQNKEILKPLLKGQDLRPYYSLNSDQYLIFTYHGIDIEKYPAVLDYLTKYRPELEKRATIKSHAWYELQQPQMGVYPKFDDKKIMYPGIAKYPRFSIDTSGSYMDNSVYFLISNGQYSIWTILALLQSRILWFALSQISAPRNIRDGLWRYVLFTQYIERLPIPELNAQQESELAAIAEETTALARSRYQLHEDMRRTIISEFDGEAINTRVALYRWWDFADEKALSDELKKQFKREIPLGKRSDWRGFLAQQKAEHHVRTEAIIALETRLNAIVYDAFHLTPEERQLIETSTKYPYGEV